LFRINQKKFAFMLNIFLDIFFLFWTLISISLFFVFPAKKAICISLFTGWMFLPCHTVYISKLPELTRDSSVALGVLAGLVLVHPATVLRFRPRWIDLFVVAFCLSGLFASLSNGLGLYDGLSALFSRSLIWMTFYFIGRIYFSDSKSMLFLVKSAIVLTLLYIPFIVWEMRFSPQLNNIIYGFSQKGWAELVRFGGYRPLVFMPSSLLLSLWLGIMTLACTWLWLSGAVKKILGFDIRIYTVLYLAIFLNTRSLGAIAIFTILITSILLLNYANVKFQNYLLIAFVIAYITLRLFGHWDGSHLVQVAEKFGEDRAGSLTARMNQENLLRDRTRERIVFGWGQWGRNTSDINIRGVDSFWLIYASTNGIFSIISIYLSIIIPLLILTYRSPIAYWRSSSAAGVVICCYMLFFFLLDSLFNSFPTPPYMLAIGALSGLSLKIKNVTRYKTAHYIK
jgi:hypothetical protein